MMRYGALKYISAGLLATILMPLSAAASTPPSAAPSPPPVACSLNSTFSDFSHIISVTGPTAMTPMTLVLPPDGNAWVAFRQPLQNNAGTTSASTNLFLIYETDVPSGPDSGFIPIDLQINSIAPADSNAPAGFLPTDSTQIQFKISQKPLPLWGNHHFTVVECSPSGQFIAWGHVVARVSSPNIAYGIASLVSLGTYILSMLGIYWQRKRNSETSDKYLANTYPALFGAKKLSFRDFLNPIYLTEDAFHRASVQKAQVLLFSFLVGWLLLSLVLRIGTLEDLSLTVVGLMGISGIGAATSHVTYQQKTSLSFVNLAWLQKKTK